MKLWEILSLNFIINKNTALGNKAKNKCFFYAFLLFPVMNAYRKIYNAMYQIKTGFIVEVCRKEKHSKRRELG
jgi:hypothetical protein